MNIYKVLPDLKKKRHLSLWHKALRSQWSAEDVNWGQPQRITKDALKDQLARLLTPILMGEQSALYSVSGLIPILGQCGDVESQFYLTTWAVDEARHTELFARFYGRMDREPMSIRRFPSGYLFQSQIMSKDPAEWLAGVLFSEVLAKLVLEEFRRLDLDPVLSDISNGILEDEARHLGFNHIYLEDRLASMFRKDQHEGRTYEEHLRTRLQKVLDLLIPIFTALKADTLAVGLDSEGLLHNVGVEAKRRLEKSMASGEKVAAGTNLVSQPKDAEEIGA